MSTTNPFTVKNNREMLDKFESSAIQETPKVAAILGASIIGEKGIALHLVIDELLPRATIIRTMRDIADKLENDPQAFSGEFTGEPAAQGSC